MSTNQRRFSTNGDTSEHLKDQRTKQIVESLGSRFSKLNSLWEAAEAGLKKIPIPIDVHFCYAEEDENPDGSGFTYYYHIGFVKHHGGWRICHGGYTDAGPREFDWKPIAECPLDVRVEVVAHIARLREQVLEAAGQCLPALDQAIATFQETLESW